MNVRKTITIGNGHEGDAENLCEYGKSLREICVCCLIQSVYPLLELFTKGGSMREKSSPCGL